MKFSDLYKDKIVYPIDDIRAQLIEYMIAEGLTINELAARIGVAFYSLGRFLRNEYEWKRTPRILSKLVAFLKKEQHGK